MLRTKKLLLAVPLVLIAPGCITACMWDHVDRRAETAAAIALTPVTVALDAALIAGYVWLECADESCCQPRPRCR